jgi:phenylalanyl-tRNA synthetase beta chain
MCSARSQVNSVLEILERNARLRDRLAMFEIGPVFFQEEEGELPKRNKTYHHHHRATRHLPSWQDNNTWKSWISSTLKGLSRLRWEGLQVGEIEYQPAQNHLFHPGKCALVSIRGNEAGMIGQLHPLVQERYDLSDFPVLVADLDLATVLSAIPERYDIRAVPTLPPVLEDLAVVVEETIPAARVEDVIRSAGGRMVTDMRLFDVYRGEQVGHGKKSLAYSLTYNDPERTLTDQDVAKIRERIIQKLAQELDAKLRS